jgi:L-lactate dehydrogenase complex protein LldG
MDTARENIFRRVRAALRVEAPRPDPPSAAAIWPPSGDFRQEFEAVRGEFVEDLQKFLTSFARIATDASKIVRRTVGEGNTSVHNCEIGVTGCECLVAQTGTVIVSGGRAISVLPPVHLVIATRDQIVPDLTTAMRLLWKKYAGRWPSSLSAITGPSRTADIEKTLVFGAHGPRRLALYFADGAARAIR